MASGSSEKWRSDAFATAGEKLEESEESLN